MDRLRRRRGDEVPDEWRASVPRAGSSKASEADSLLDLQARAGNRAVTELVGAPGGAVRPWVQRDGVDGTPTTTPADTGTAPRVDTMSIPDLKLGVPIQSFQTNRRSPRRDDSKESAAGDVTVTLLPEHLDAGLWEAATKGRQFGVITIKLGSATITLKGVLISSVQMGTNEASLTLNFTSMEFQPGEKPQPPTSDWEE